MVTIRGAAATLSWIDPKAPAAGVLNSIFGVNDPQPPNTITEAVVTRQVTQAGISFRFSNYIKAWITTSDEKTISDAQWDIPPSGIYRFPSALGFQSYEMTIIREGPIIQNNTRGHIEYAVFIQTVGARTVTQEIVGGSLGSAVGAGIGVVAGYEAALQTGLLLGAPFGPVGLIAGGVLGLGAGAVLGWAAGKNLANKIVSFPVIWTKLELTLHANGLGGCLLQSNSTFPSITTYCDVQYDGVLKQSWQEYSALDNEQAEWEKNGWGAGNPWGFKP